MTSPTNCSVCLEVVTRDSFDWPCGHVGHVKCISQLWAYNQRPRCPVCREAWPRDRPRTQRWRAALRACNCVQGVPPSGATNDDEVPQREPPPPRNVVPWCHRHVVSVGDPSRPPEFAWDTNSAMDWAPQFVGTVNGVDEYTPLWLCNVCGRGIEDIDPELAVPHPVPICHRCGVERALIVDLETNTRFLGVCAWLPPKHRLRLSSRSRDPDRFGIKYG